MLLKSKVSVVFVMIEYKGLIDNLKEKGITKSSLSSSLGVSSRTIAKIARGEKISDRVLAKIANYLDCPVKELCKEVSDNPILRILQEEKNIKMPGGLYHELQVRMTYNSNHIEGSTLDEEQTRLIFETNTIDADKGVPVDDIIETCNHFRAIDFVIDNADKTLCEDIIKELHKLLKQNTKDSELEWFVVGDYKQRANFVGGHKTAKPAEVHSKMQKLIKEYNALNKTTIEDIIEFHYNFENIHPFQDGNGRVGRLIALKECLHFNIVPFIIEDLKKTFYYRGLSKWNEEKGYLIETCLDGQDTFKKMLDELEICY